MKKIVQQFILIASIALLIGCNRVDEGNVPAKLNLLEKTFEVQLPTNYTNEYGALLTYARGGSEIIARLEVTDSAFSSWRQSVTNKLSEMHGFKISADQNLEKRFPWWDCSKFPYTEIVHYYTDKHAGQNGYLDVFVVETNEIHTMYIEGSIF